MRKPPAKPAEFVARQNVTVITQVREYQLITPLFGGGVTPMECDPITIIRATEIRGHLRFWWRATRGGKSGGDMAKMKEEEDRIWGKAGKKGEQGPKFEDTVQLTITLVTPEKTDNVDHIKPYVKKPDKKRPEHMDNLGIHRYVDFPLQEELKSVYTNITFKMTISFPKNCKSEESEKEILAALWAWETFGGIGARTRRGFGALRCLSIEETCGQTTQNLPLEEAPTESLRSFGQWLERNLKKHVVPGSWPKDVPYLNREPVKEKHYKTVIMENNLNAYKVWYELINCLNSFRQVRHGSLKQPGRNQWPEPSAIRKITGQSLERHEKPIPDPLLNKFPRAAFGLPIIFKFKDNSSNKVDDKKSDPRKTVLQLKGYERFASPLILKPIACQKGIYIGLALILEGTRLGEKMLELNAQEGLQLSSPQKYVRANLDHDEDLKINTLDNETQICLNNQTDALQAFLKYL